MTTVHVTIELYSGRENPRWTLVGSDAEEFLRRVSTLSPMAWDGVSDPAGLGYRGLEAVATSGSGKRRYLVGAGAVAPEGSSRLHDPGHEVERWLLLTGRKTLGAELLNYVLGTLGSP